MVKCFHLLVTVLSLYQHQFAVAAWPFHLNSTHFQAGSNAVAAWRFNLNSTLLGASSGKLITCDMNHVPVCSLVHPPSPGPPFFPKPTSLAYSSTPFTHTNSPKTTIKSLPPFPPPNPYSISIPQFATKITIEWSRSLLHPRDETATHQLLTDMVADVAAHKDAFGEVMGKNTYPSGFWRRGAVEMDVLEMGMTWREWCVALRGLVEFLEKYEGVVVRWRVWRLGGEGEGDGERCVGTGGLRVVS